MDIPYIFDFLKTLSANNNREWFHAHKDDYEYARDEFEKLLGVVIARISRFDDSVREVEPWQCTYRIYRDTRFSADKTPYKTHFGGYINACGKKSEHCGYYLHLEPGGCMLAGGSYCPPPALLKRLRQSVFDNINEFRSIVEDPSFCRYFPVVGETFLKTAPKGFPRDFPDMKYLRCKDYIVSCRVEDSFFLLPDFLERTDDIFKQLKRYSDFLNYTIDEVIADGIA